MKIPDHWKGSPGLEEYVEEILLREREIEDSVVVRSQKDRCHLKRSREATERPSTIGRMAFASASERQPNKRHAHGSARVRTAARDRHRGSYWRPMLSWFASCQFICYPYVLSVSCIPWQEFVRLQRTLDPEQTWEVIRDTWMCRLTPTIITRLLYRNSRIDSIDGIDSIDSIDGIVS